MIDDKEKETNKDFDFFEDTNSGKTAGNTKGNPNNTWDDAEYNYNKWVND